MKGETIIIVKNIPDIMNVIGMVIGITADIIIIITLIIMIMKLIIQNAGNIIILQTFMILMHTGVTAEVMG